MFLHLGEPQGCGAEGEGDEYGFFGALLEGTGITRGSAIAPGSSGCGKTVPTDTCGQISHENAVNMD